MNKRIIIGLFCVLVFSACASIISIDDAYHWEDKTSAMTSHVTTSASSATNTGSASTKDSNVSSGSYAVPSMEYINVQDTTITVRIKR